MRPACRGSGKRKEGSEGKEVKYRLIIFDIDGTITEHISSWRYIHEKLGLWDVLARKYQQQFLAGKIGYRKFCELDAAHWKGMKVSELRRIFLDVGYAKNAVKAIRKLKAGGFKLAAVSTGLQFMTERVKKELKFDHVTCNRLRVYKGILTGGVKINISHGAKDATVREILKKTGVKASETIAVGDSEGDIPMMRMAGYSIAFNSSSNILSDMADHNCKGDDFMEVSFPGEYI
jgi:phosphoserine phosphatase